MHIYRLLVLFISILCFCIDISSSASSPFFRKDYVYSPETQNFYKVHTSKVKFADAVNRCQLEGATLLVLETKLERDVIINLVDAKYPKDSKALWPEHYIAVHDSFSEGEFVTLDGRSTDTIFMDWDSNEPDNNGNEDCVLLRRTGKMNDVNCDWSFRFICEKSHASVAWNSLCELPDANYLFNKQLGKCYKLHMKPKTWKDAYATCTAEQSYLAIVNNQAEADYLVKIVSEVDKTGIKAPHFYAHAAYLGFHNHFISGFITVKGQPLEELGYTRWAAGQPDNAGDERCGSMFFDGGLNDLTCSLNAIFICEHDIESTYSNLDVSTSTSSHNFGNDYVFSSETQNFYKVHTSKVTFVDAVNQCKLEGATLLVLENKLERDFIINLVDAKYPKDSKALWPEHYIAVHDSFSEGEFVTFDGRSTDTIFMDWDFNEPDNNGNEDCVLLRRTGKMNDVNCDWKFRFICEKSTEVPISLENSHSSVESNSLHEQHDVSK